MEELYRLVFYCISIPILSRRWHCGGGGDWQADDGGGESDRIGGNNRIPRLHQGVRRSPGDHRPGDAPLQAGPHRPYRLLALELGQRIAEKQRKRPRSGRSLCRQYH